MEDDDFDFGFDSTSAGGSGGCGGGGDDGCGGVVVGASISSGRGANLIRRGVSEEQLLEDDGSC